MGKLSRKSDVEFWKKGKAERNLANFIFLV